VLAQAAPIAAFRGTAQPRQKTEQKIDLNKTTPNRPEILFFTPRFGLALTHGTLFASRVIRLGGKLLQRRANFFLHQVV
jgi:hypothetical protein